MGLKTTDVTIARVYLTEGTHALDDILDYLKNDAKIRGFSVFRAIRGFGETGEHASRLIDVSLNLPLVIELFDDKATIEPVLAYLTRFVHPKHIVFWPAQTNLEGMS